MPDRHDSTLRPGPLLLGREVQQRAEPEAHFGCDQDPQPDDRVHGPEDYGRGCDASIEQLQDDGTARRRSSRLGHHENGAAEGVAVER